MVLCVADPLGCCWVVCSLSCALSWLGVFGVYTNKHVCCLPAGENSGDAQAAAEAAQEASRKAAIAAGLLPESAGAGGAGSAAEDVEAARVRRLKAQGRFMPY